MSEDSLLEKEKTVAGVKKYVVMVAWYDMDFGRRRDAVFVEAFSAEEARNTACALVEEDIKEEQGLGEEDYDVAEHTVHHQSVKLVDEIEYPSIR